MIDKSSYGPGPWQEEPDYANWTDEATGLQCLIVRSEGSGALCGYVGVEKHHPAYGLSYDSVTADVHGGLTYSGPCQGRICHVGQTDDIWWLGFDCAHIGDLTPTDRTRAPTIYRDFAYVKAEVQSLAHQLGSG